MTEDGCSMSPSTRTIRPSGSVICWKTRERGWRRQRGQQKRSCRKSAGTQSDQYRSSDWKAISKEPSHDIRQHAPGTFRSSWRISVPHTSGSSRASPRGQVMNEHAGCREPFCYGPRTISKPADRRDAVLQKTDVQRRIGMGAVLAADHAGPGWCLPDSGGQGDKRLPEG